MTTYALYGGSFDPPHLSHVLSATWAQTAHGIERIFVVPTWLHAFEKTPGANFEARLEMCRLAFEALSYCEVSDIERQLGGVSRSYDTLKALSDAHPQASFRLLIGADITHEVHAWHRWEELEKLAPPIIAGRQGYPEPDGDPILLPAISSTQIRERLAQSKNVANLLPQKVADYITKHQLYKDEK